MEFILGIAGALCVGEVIKLIIMKIFSKKKDSIAEKKDEFAALREMIEYNQQEINRLTRKEGANNRRIVMMYNFIAEMVMQTCSKANCKMRKLIDFDTSIFEDDNWEKEGKLFEENKQETEDDIENGVE